MCTYISKFVIVILLELFKGGLKLKVWEKLECKKVKKRTQYFLNNTKVARKLIKKEEKIHQEV